VIPFRAAMKRRLRCLVNLPRYGPVALHDPQQQVEVWFEDSGEPRNVTRNNVVVALRPFTIGLMFDADSTPGNGSASQLCMRDADSHQLLGAINLRPAGVISLPGRHFRLFETTACENYSVPPAILRFYYMRERWRAKRRQRRNPFNFKMSPMDLRCSYVFYICPRPVVLVTVEHQDASNMFPMDLIGPTDSPWFSMALRSTSPAVRLMQQSRRMSLASVPVHYQSIVYELGKHHRLPSVDLANLPFPIALSSTFGLPVMKDALLVREVEVAEFHEVGSHVLFLTTMVSESRPEYSGRPQLFHAFGSYRKSLSTYLSS
jgi:flavin reductase (DIM6/NTAB) family NADH-FMN oxidoreductase RutF